MKLDGYSGILVPTDSDLSLKTVIEDSLDMVAVVGKLEIEKTNIVR